MNEPDLELQVADESHLQLVLPLVRDYHAFEKVEMTDADRVGALMPLLDAGAQLGRIWLVRSGDAVIGYGALCFGYSIEFRGRDAFVDELFIAEGWRGRGLGSRVVNRLKAEARALGIVALHLEVARTNDRARQMYEKWGFLARERYHLMSCNLGRPA